MIRLKITKRFYASHAVRLRHGPEPRHGHDWNLVVELESDESIDPRDLESAVARIVGPMEKSDLNEIGELKPFGATAESLARHLHHKCSQVFESKSIRVFAIRLEEEPGCWASYYER